MNALKSLKAMLQVAALSVATCTFAWGATITIAPAAPAISNCYPFGAGSGGNWPYTGFVYQNIPAFSLQPGDTLAFDLGAPNDANIQLQIEMAATTVNGGDVPAGAFTTIVPNTQTPANPMGDAITGNFELRFTATASFNFPGGGLIIRFSNPSAAYQLDSSCTQVMVYGASSDASTFFVKRYWSDADGLPPYSSTDTSYIGAFQIVNNTAAPIPTLSQWGVITLVGLLAFGTFVVTRRRES